MKQASYGKVSNARECHNGECYLGITPSQLQKEKKEKYDPGARTLVFVFATLSETIGWVNWYFTEDAEKLAQEPTPLGPEG